MHACMPSKSDGRAAIRSFGRSFVRSFLLLSRARVGRRPSLHTVEEGKKRKQQLQVLLDLMIIANHLAILKQSENAP